MIQVRYLVGRTICEEFREQKVSMAAISYQLMVPKAASA